MISRRFAAALIAAPAALSLAACASSTTDGNGGGGPTGSAASSATGSAPTSASSSASTPTSAASSSASGSSSMPQDAKGLYALMIAGQKKTTSLRVEIDASTAGQSLKVLGDEKLNNGKVTAMRITEALPGGNQTIEILLVDGKIYAKLPSQINNTGKPYLAITSTSKDATVRQLATSLQSSLNSASTGQYAAFTQAADQFKQVGPTTVNGTAGTRYDITMNPTKLPPDYKNKASLVATGLTAIPIQLVVDSSGRLLSVDLAFTYQGKKVTTKVIGSRYNRPVNIAAPPASQVGTK